MFGLWSLFCFCYLKFSSIVHGINMFLQRMFHIVHRIPDSTNLVSCLSLGVFSLAVLSYTFGGANLQMDPSGVETSKNSPLSSSVDPRRVV